jgi:tetratricopeptide (TPR) repeat protein
MKPIDETLLKLVDREAVASIEISTTRTSDLRLELRTLPTRTSIELEVTDLRDLTLLRHFTNVMEVKLSGCSDLESLRGLDLCKKIKKLIISGCPSLTSLDGVEHLEDCDFLKIIDCPKLASVAVAIAHPGVKEIELHESTAVVSVREQLGANHDNAKKLVVYSPGVRVPFISLMAARDRGLDPLSVYESAIIECLACGSVRFEGKCSGWYSQKGYAELSRSEGLGDGPLGDAVSGQWDSMEQELADLIEQGGIEDEVGGEIGWEANCFSSIDSSICCLECSDPFGVNDPELGSTKGILNQLFGVYSAGSTDELSDINRNEIVIPLGWRAVADAEDATPRGSCPICGVGCLSVGVRSICFRGSSGKFAGSVHLQSNTYRHFSRHVEVDDSDEKVFDGWNPDDDEAIIKYLACDFCQMGIAPSFFGSSGAQDAVAALLAAVSCHEALKPNPSVHRLGDWMSKANLGVPFDLDFFKLAGDYLLEMHIKIIGDDASAEVAASTVDLDALQTIALQLIEDAALLQPENRRTLALQLDCDGAKFQSQGDLKEALAHYEKALGIWRALAKELNTLQSSQVLVAKLTNVAHLTREAEYKQGRGGIDDSCESEKLLREALRIAGAWPLGLNLVDPIRDLGWSLASTCHDKLKQVNILEFERFYAEWDLLMSELAVYDINNGTYYTAQQLYSMVEILEEHGRVDEARICMARLKEWDDRYNANEGKE